MIRLFKTIFFVYFYNKSSRLTRAFFSSFKFKLMKRIGPSMSAEIVINLAEQVHLIFKVEAIATFLADGSECELVQLASGDT